VAARRASERSTSRFAIPSPQTAVTSPLHNRVAASVYGHEEDVLRCVNAPSFPTHPYGNGSRSYRPQSSHTVATTMSFSMVRRPVTPAVLLATLHMTVLTRPDDEFEDYPLSIVHPGSGRATRWMLDRGNVTPILDRDYAPPHDRSRAHTEDVNGSICLSGEITMLP